VVLKKTHRRGRRCHKNHLAQAPGSPDRARICPAGVEVPRLSLDLELSERRLFLPSSAHLRVADREDAVQIRRLPLFMTHVGMARSINLKDS